MSKGVLPDNAPERPGLALFEIARFVLEWRATQQRTRRER